MSQFPKWVLCYQLQMRMHAREQLSKICLPTITNYKCTPKSCIGILHLTIPMLTSVNTKIKLINEIMHRMELHVCSESMGGPTRCYTNVWNFYYVDLGHPMPY